MKYIAIGFILIFTSCQDVKRPKAPENLIKEGAMVEIMTDAYLMNAARSINIRKIRKEGISLDSILYAKYNIDSLQFAQSNAYYTNDLNTYNDLFLKVEQKLIVEKAKRDSLYEIYKESRAEEKRLDSIYRARIDSMLIEMPAISRDSIEVLLDIEMAKTTPFDFGITEESAVSQDSLL